MKCLLCRNNEAIKNSHIIPEWMYENCYDDKHRFINRTNNADYHQKGYRSEILCTQCETKLSRWEKQLKLLWDAIGKIDSHNSVFDLSPFIYADIRLALLSILWRIGVSPSIINWDIGDSNLRKLRKCLLAEIDPPEHFFPCAVSKIVLLNGSTITGLIDIQKPTFLNRRCSIILKGLLIDFFLSPKLRNKYIINNCITKNMHFRVRSIQLSQLGIPLAKYLSNN